MIMINIEYTYIYTYVRLVIDISNKLYDQMKISVLFSFCLRRSRWS